MKKVGVMLMSMLLVVTLFVGCGGKGDPVDVGFKAEDVQAVMVSQVKVTGEEAGEPGLKMVMNQDEIKTIIDATGKMTYKKDKNADDAKTMSNEANVIFLIFLPKEGDAKLFGYLEAGKKAYVIMNDGHLYEGGGEAPFGIYDGLTDDMAKAMEEGVDLNAALEALNSFAG